VEEILLNIETSIPLGLIISELISNSLKYAFPNKKEGIIKLTLEANDNDYNLIISDDGVGLPEDVDYRNTESSLGLRLVNSLVKQLDGSIELNRSQGTQFIIKFKELQYKDRL
jgi:two-component sensor histidine kinase